jgi:hypothetical protein
VGFVKLAGWALGGLLALVVLFLVALQIPPLSDALVTAALNLAGYGPARVRGAHVGPYGASIAAGSLGTPGADLQFKELVVGYAFPNVMWGETRAIRAKWMFAKALFENGKLQLPLVKPRAARVKAKRSALPKLPKVEIEQLWGLISGFETSLAMAGKLSLAPTLGSRNRYSADYVGMMGSDRHSVAWNLQTEFDTAGNLTAKWNNEPDSVALPRELAASVHGGPILQSLFGSMSIQKGMLDRLTVVLRLGIGSTWLDTDSLDASLRIEGGRGWAQVGGGVQTPKACDQYSNRFRAWLQERWGPLMSSAILTPIANDLFSPTKTASPSCSVSGVSHFSMSRDLSTFRVQLIGLSVLKGTAVVGTPNIAVPPPPKPATQKLSKIPGNVAVRPAVPDVKTQVAIAVQLPGHVVTAQAEVELGVIPIAPISMPERLNVRDLRIAWPAPSLILDFDVSTADYNSSSGVTLDGGRLSLDGVLGDSQAKNLALGFSGDAKRAGSAWHIVPRGGCVSATFDAITTSSLRAERGSAKACAAEGQPLAVIDPEGDMLVAAHGSYAFAPALVNFGGPPHPAPGKARESPAPTLRNPLPPQAVGEGTFVTGKFPEGPFDLSIGKSGTPIRLAAGVAAGPLLIRAGKEAGIRIASLAADTVMQIGAEGLTLSAPGIRAKLEDAAASPRFAPMGVAGAIEAAHGKANGQFAASAFGQKLITATLAHDLVGGAGTFAFDTGALQFRRDGLALQQLLPILRGQVTGAEGAARTQGKIAWLPGRKLASTGTVTLRKLGVTTRLGRIDGIDGEAKLSNLFPLTTATPQSFKIGFARVGLPLQDGIVQFRLPGDGSLEIPSAVWPWASGTLAIVDAAFVPGAPVQHLAMSARGIDLTQVFRLVSIDGLSGSGIVDGRLPIDIRDGQGTIIAGTFKARASGILSYKGKAATAAATAKGADLVFAALEDFHYDSLGVTVDGPLTGEITLALKLTGYNPKVYDGHPFVLNVQIKSALANLLLETTKGLRIPGEIEGAVSQPK